MFHINYPPYFPNLHFIAGILTILAVNYYVNTRNFAKSYKYGFTAFCLFLMFILPYPFFESNRLFGSLPGFIDDYRAYIPFLLIYYLVILFKYYSLQMNVIKNFQKPPRLSFVMMFQFILPHYVLGYSEEGIRPKEGDFDRSYHLKQMAWFFIKIIGIYALIISIIAFSPIPWNLIATSMKGWQAIPIIFGCGVVVILIFLFASALMSMISAFYNVFGGYNFKYYDNKAFLATSVSDFWSRWNLWGQEWFKVHLIKPVIKRWKLKANQIILLIFAFSAVIHAYIITLVNVYFAWLVIIAFMLNGLVVMYEKPVLEKFPFFSRLPKFIKTALTLIFIAFTMGLVGLSYTKWP